MKIANGKIIPAYRALTSLAAQPLPLPLAWALHKLKNALQPLVDFYCQEEQKAIDQCGGQVDPAGKISFPAREGAEAFARKAEALNAMEADVDASPVALDPDALAHVKITLNDLAALSCFLKEE